MIPSSESPIAAWEEAKGARSVLRAFAALVAALLLRPLEFFRSLKTPQASVSARGRLIRAVIFALILGYLKLLLDLVNIFWLKHFSGSALPPGLDAQISLVAGAVLSSPLFLLRPLLVFVLSFGFVAAGAKLVLGFDRPLEPLFLVVCYKSAADVFYALPFVGGILASVWALALILIGVRELYGINLWRAVFAAVILPFLLLFFVVLSVGPGLNRAILKFYPELRMQVKRLNDLTGYMNTLAIANAAKTYKQELGFYPANLDVLKKYIPKSVTQDVTDPENASGYVYAYSRPDDDHFILRAYPSGAGLTGRLVFYVDETHQVRLNDASGPIIAGSQDIDRLEALSQERTQE